MEIFGIKFFIIAFASCIFTLKECMNLSICVVFCIIKLLKKKTTTILLEGIKIFNDNIARKLSLVILIGWSLDIARYLEFTMPEKDPRLLA